MQIGFPSSRETLRTMRISSAFLFMGAMREVQPRDIQAGANQIAKKRLPYCTQGREWQRSWHGGHARAELLPSSTVRFSAPGASNAFALSFNLDFFFSATLLPDFDFIELMPCTFCPSASEPFLFGSWPAMLTDRCVSEFAVEGHSNRGCPSFAMTES